MLLLQPGCCVRTRVFMRYAVARLLAPQRAFLACGSKEGILLFPLFWRLCRQNNGKNGFIGPPAGENAFGAASINADRPQSPPAGRENHFN